MSLCALYRVVCMVRGACCMPFPLRAIAPMERTLCYLLLKHNCPICQQSACLGVADKSMSLVCDLYVIRM